MNYLVSVLFVLACINFTTQDKATAVNETLKHDEVVINGKPSPLPDTVNIIPPQPTDKNKTTTTEKPTTITPIPTTISPNSTTPNPNTTTPNPNTTTTVPTKPTTASTTTSSTSKPTPSTVSTTQKPIPPPPSPSPSPSTTTVSPVTTEKPQPEPHRRFDGPSFIGGIVLALGLVAIGFVAFKFYKARLEVNYHTL